MKALISTVNYIFQLDVFSRKLNLVESHRPEYYGISWFPEGEELILSHSGLENDSLINIDDYANSERGFLSFDSKHTRPFLSTPHQILCAPNGWIVITNTGRNCITIYDPKSGFLKELMVNDVRWDRLSKNLELGEHFNSVFIKNDKLYVLAHGLSKASAVYIFDFKSLELMERYAVNGAQMHNIYVDEQNNIYSLKTLSGELIELKTNKLLWKANCSVFIRGLAVTKNYILIGGSEFSANRESRKKVISEVWVIDRNTYQTIDCIELGPYGAVHDIRVVDEPDYAHHGAPFKNLDALNKINKLEQTERGRKRFQNSSHWMQNKEIFENFFVELGGLENDNGWLKPYEESLSIVLHPKEVKDHYECSLEYSFDSIETAQEQHLSLVVGYKGRGDANMIAILIGYKQNYASLDVWQHANGAWQQLQTLATLIDANGKLHISRNKNELLINCNQSQQYVVHFNDTVLDGNVGVRCIGSKFKNFVVN